VLGHDPFSEKRTKKRAKGGAKSRPVDGKAAPPPPPAPAPSPSPPPAPDNGAPSAPSELGAQAAPGPPPAASAARERSEESQRREMEEILRTALRSMEQELRAGVDEQRLRDVLACAVREATGEQPKGSTPLDLMGGMAAKLVQGLAVPRVQAVLESVDPLRVAEALRVGADIAQALLGPLHPTHMAQVDEFGFDEGFTDRLLPIFEFLFTTYWRCDLHGVENVPAQGRGLIVANHSGVIPWDATMLFTGIRRHHPQRRHLRCLMLDLFATLPFVGTLFTRLGQIRACPENGQQLLERDHLVGVFPEGLKGIGKLFSERYRLQRFGRGGYVRLAMRARAPIVPTAVVGGEEIYPLFFRADWLARLFNFPYFPITLTFPWLGLLGVIPLPSKWVILIGSPIDVSEYSPGDADDDLVVNDLSDRIKEQIQDMLFTGLKERRSAFLG